MRVRLPRCPKISSLQDAMRHGAHLTGMCKSEPHRIRYVAMPFTDTYASLVCIFYRQPGSECPVSTPALPIPGDSISRTGAGTHSLDHECPARDALLGDTFPALCHFWRIVHGAKWIYYPEEQSPPKKYEMNLAEHKFRELIAWVERLPRSLARTEKSPHHVDVFQ